MEIPRRMHRNLAAALVASLYLLTTPTAVRAATIQEANSNKDCAFSLEGSIVTGDAKAFNDMIERNLKRFDEFDERTTSLCLNSPGGLYDEAVEISEIIYRRGISTVVRYSSECFSACAIIFMAGTSRDQLLPLRKLSAGGILGFHAPYFVMPSGQYSKEQVEEISQSMRQAILALMRLASMRTGMRATDFIRKSLIQGILEKGPDESLFVRTVIDAARWGILIYDAAEHYSIPIDKADGMKNMCGNFHYANMDEHIPRNARWNITIEEYTSKFHHSDFRILVRDNANPDVACELYPRESTDGKRKISVFACSIDYASAKSFGNCRDFKTSPLFGRYVPDFFALDPNTHLKKFTF